MINPPLRGPEHNNHRRRELTGTHQDGGTEHALRRGARQAANGPAGTWQANGTGNPGDDNNPGNTPQREAQQRLRNEPRSTLTQPKRRRKQLTIASLNMNGRGDRAQDKWGAINNAMKRRRIAVLGLQETHPSNEMQETIGRRFRNTLHTVHSAAPLDPGRTGGVSFVIQKSLISAKDTTYREIIPGRVILIEIPWNENDKLRIMNVYAPARNTEKAAFWNRLLETIENDENLRPDIILGDFNIVENPEIDRLNNRRGADPAEARNTLADLTVELNLVDRWRRRHPRKRGYTFCRDTQSRLDRIYMNEDLYPWCTDWKIEHPGFETDHSLVSVQASSENMPFIGKGRWAIPVGLLKNKKLKEATQALTKRLQTEVEQTTVEN